MGPASAGHFVDPASSRSGPLSDPANAGPLLDSTRSGLVNLVNYASAGHLVDPATAGPISESSRSWSLN